MAKSFRTRRAERRLGRRPQVVESPRVAAIVVEEPENVADRGQAFLEGAERIDRTSNHLQVQVSDLSGAVQATSRICSNGVFYP